MNENDACAHHREFDKLNSTCFTLEDLKKISMYYNQSNTNKIDVTTNKKDKLLKELNSKLSQCNNDHICFLNQQFIKDKQMIHDVFKPQGTKGKIDWLSTIEINKIMEQYEKKHKNFKFIGAIPRDCLKINYPIMNDEIFIKNLDINYFIDNNYNTIAFVYNLDESWQSGSHWVALYFNIEKCQIYFFDSYGLKPHKDIRIMIRKLANFCYHYHKTDCVKKCKLVDSSESYMNQKKNKLEKIFNIEFNQNRHQFKNTECGVYSLHFIINLLSGKSFSELTKNVLKDEHMIEYRSILFRKFRRATY